MQRATLLLLLLFGATNLHAKFAELEPLFQQFLTLEETTLREFLVREDNVSELMVDVSEGIDPPEYIGGLICYTCYNCEYELDSHESPAICNECYVSLSELKSSTRHYLSTLLHTFHNPPFTFRLSA